MIFCAGVFAEESSVSRLMEQGIDDLVNNKNDSALRIFNQVLLVDPKNGEAFYRLGQVYLNKKDIAKALEFVKKSTQADPLNVRYSLNLAGLYESVSDLQSAKKEYQRIIDTGTTDKRVKEAEKRIALYSGRDLAKKGEYNAALLIFNGLLLDYPNDPEVLYNIGLAYVYLDRVQEAETIFTKLIAIDPKNPIALLNLANIFERTNRPEDAMRQLKVVIDQDMKNDLDRTARIQYGIINGRELIRRQDWVNAAKAFQEVVEIDPTRTEAFFNIALVNLTMGNIKEAEKGFLAVLKVTPGDLSARLNLGGLYFDNNDPAKAKEQFQYVIDNDKAGKYRQQAQARLNVLHTTLADKALQEGKVQESLNEYKKALDFYSGNVRASFNRGIIYIQQKQFQEAKVEFESVVRFDPNNLRARMNLAMIYEQLNQLTKAADQYEIVAQIDKNSDEGKIALAKWKITKARGLWADRQLTAAENLFEDVVREEPNNFEAFAYLGIIQQSKGKWQEAAGSFQRVMDLRPGNARVRMMLAQVYEQLGLDNLAATEYRSILFNGAEQDVVGEANNRLGLVESRLSGFFNALNYQMSYDSNMNMNDANPAREVRTDLAVDVIYSYKYGDEYNLRITYSPTYTSLHETGSDFLRQVFNSSLVRGTPEESVQYSFGYQNQQSILNELDVSQAADFGATYSKKLFAKAIFGLAPEGFEGQRIPSGLSANMNLRGVKSIGGTAITSITGGTGVFFNQGLRAGYHMTLGYQLGINRNLANLVQINTSTVLQPNPITGVTESIPKGSFILYDSHDYEFNSHTLTLNLQQVLAPGFSLTVPFSAILSNYVNPDSSARVQKQERYRLNVTLVAGGTLNYRFFKDMSFFVNGNLMRNFSNMPIGYTKDDVTKENQVAENNRAIATFQNSSLGSFSRVSFTSGFIMNF